MKDGTTSFQQIIMQTMSDKRRIIKGFITKKLVMF